MRHGVLRQQDQGRRLPRPQEDGTRRGRTLTVQLPAALRPGRRTGPISVNGYLIQNPAAAQNPPTPSLEEDYRYFFYFLTGRGRQGLQRDREGLARVVWHRDSPRQQFTEAEFAQAAAPWTNPDNVNVVIHSYRHRLPAAPDDPRYADPENRLLGHPRITVPTVTPDGADPDVDDPAPAPLPSSRGRGRGRTRGIRGPSHGPFEHCHSRMY
ncbi:hypothetical protein ACFY6U_06160 [Streptomyces sp. NPDC013157]|uniref:hypothetical protein n=1 Tax=Streptomyces sp. NPDC013157 TaxID=3364861 RepID=UPI003688AD3A